MYSLSIYCSISKSIFSVSVDTSVDWMYYCMQGICSSGFRIKKWIKEKRNRNCGWRLTLNRFKCSTNNPSKGLNQDGYTFFLTEMVLEGQEIGLSGSRASYSNRKNSRHPLEWPNKGWDSNVANEVPIYSIKRIYILYNKRIQFDPIHLISIPIIIMTPYKIMKVRHAFKKHTHS